MPNATVATMTWASSRQKAWWILDLAVADMPAVVLQRQVTSDEDTSEGVENIVCHVYRV